MGWFLVVLTVGEGGRLMMVMDGGCRRLEGWRVMGVQEERFFVPSQTGKGIFLHQTKYVADILKRFQVEEERSAKTPLSVNHGISPDCESAKVDPTLYRAIIGSLMYLTASRPDIMFAVFLCARYQANPNVHHMFVVKKILRYLKDSPSLGLWYPCEDGFDLTAYSDFDYGGCKKDFKSTSGGCQFLCSKLVTWQCKKQTVVAQSTCEVEYIAAASCTSQIIWIQQQLRDYGVKLLTDVVLETEAPNTEEPPKKTEL
ncbi:secreted RxLR effector protein 161-like [Rutidosis leptorrhynchoides]|uniref:secreted RxLR effector protein 161-like n=1 Tax=Rutidosis leptorrhynchoides TaxID=125765 RepID=UPI003A996E44